MAEMKHMANKQMERHMNKAMGEPKEEKTEGEHHSFHVAHHPVHGTHSTHTHAGGIDHAEHASPEEAMEHGKQVMGGMAEPAGMGGQSESADGWGAEE